MHAGGVPHAFPPDVVAAVCRHMDEDHAEEALRIVRVLGGRPGATAVRTTGVDGAGLRFDVDGEPLVVPFAREITTRAEIREQVVALHRAAEGA